MKFRFSTPVEAPLERVLAQVDRRLFEQLAPPFPRLRVVAFEGSSPGDQVKVELDFWLFKSLWHSEITERQESQEGCFFVDEGRPPYLPFGLKSWRHVHRFRRLPQGTAIEDEITYSTGFYLLDLLLYPGFLVQLGYWRKPIYRKFFAV